MYVFVYTMHMCMCMHVHMCHSACMNVRNSLGTSPHLLPYLRQGSYSFHCVCHDKWLMCFWNFSCPLLPCRTTVVKDDWATLVGFIFVSSGDFSLLSSHLWDKHLLSLTSPHRPDVQLFIEIYMLSFLCCSLPLFLRHFIPPTLAAKLTHPSSLSDISSLFTQCCVLKRIESRDSVCAGWIFLLPFYFWPHLFANSEYICLLLVGGAIFILPTYFLFFSIHFP